MPGKESLLFNSRSRNLDKVITYMNHSQIRIEPLLFIKITVFTFCQVFYFQTLKHLPSIHHDASWYTLSHQNLFASQFLITNKSPITVITVVEVVGVSFSGHTSSGCPVKRQTSASLARKLSLLPVITSIGMAEQMLRAKSNNSIISRIFPELVIRSSRSLHCKIPKSPCCTSMGCKNIKGVSGRAKR